MNKIRLFLFVAFAAALAGLGSTSLVPLAQAQEVIVAPGEGGGSNGNLYHRPGGTPQFVCWCGGTECAPCTGG
ncbi:MAG TPA: hypothetical protein VGB66_18645 [Longimicrobium sp.]|jgi:hypothetical protein